MLAADTAAAMACTLAYSLRLLPLLDASSALTCAVAPMEHYISDCDSESDSEQETPEVSVTL